MPAREKRRMYIIVRVGLSIKNNFFYKSSSFQVPFVHLGTQSERVFPFLI